jgi:peroxiredoxin
MSTQRIAVGEHARDFSLEDTHGNIVTLSKFEGKKNVYLVFNRGFS